MANFYGDDNANYIAGTSSSDNIYGYGGADYLCGKDGVDTIYGDDGYDTINGGKGNDWLYGGAGNDIFEIGGYESGWAGGLNNGWDKIYGEEGTDIIKILPTSGYTWTAVMLADVDSVEEIINTGVAPSYIYIKGTIDFTDVTTITNFAAIMGSTGTDTFIGGDLGEPLLRAGAGNDVLYGNGGNDTIWGEDGNDLIDGGSGYNSLKGGNGADKFQISSDQDRSTIIDFSATQSDKIQFTSNIATDFSQLTITDEGGSAHIHVGDVDITLNLVSASSLSSADFLFVA